MGDIDLVHVHRLSDFDIGRQFGLFLVLFAGLPLAPLAAIAGLATIRRAPRRWPAAAGRVFRGAFLIQAASLAVAVLVEVVAFTLMGTEALSEPSVQLLGLSVTASAAALPAWRAAARASRRYEPISILEPEGAERFRPGSDLR